MLRRLVLAPLGVLVLAGALMVAPTPDASAVGTCTAPAWQPATAYHAGTQVSHNGRHYTAKWWSQGNPPDTHSGPWDEWRDDGPCDESDPPPEPEPEPGGFVVGEQLFDQMFPDRNPFYTYAGLTTAMASYPGFANTGGDPVRRQEAAAFLANVSHETGGLVHIVEQNEANYPHYCDASQPYGCPAGQAAYYGRGPIQLSWNFNYRAAGLALGLDLLHNPYLVEQDPAVAWQTALWYWMTQTGPGTMTGHAAMVGGHGFGQTIRSINGTLECDGGNPAQVQSRVDRYLRFTSLLGVPAGGGLGC
ncbi:MAG: glycoside hydrolase family 19 protein [Natronosporangium sp.]